MARAAEIIRLPVPRPKATPAERAAFLRGVEHARTMARKRNVVLWSQARPRRSGRANTLALLILILTVAAAVAHAHLTGAAA